MRDVPFYKDENRKVNKLAVKLQRLEENKKSIMADVTRDNFEELFDDVVSEIKHCAFIAFDTEFSALTTNASNVTR